MEKFTLERMKELKFHKIEVNNFEGLCHQRFCGQEQTHFFRIVIRGEKSNKKVDHSFLVPICEKHMKEISLFHDVFIDKNEFEITHVKKRLE